MLLISFMTSIRVLAVTLTIRPYHVGEFVATTNLMFLMYSDSLLYGMVRLFNFLCLEVPSNLLVFLVITSN